MTNRMPRQPGPSNLLSKDDAENLRTEYSALSQYFNSLVTFRLTLLGFYLAGVGFLFSNNWPINPFRRVVGLLLTVSMYIFELRTRILFEHVANRGIEIEQKYWGGDKKDLFKQSLYTRQFPKKSENNYGVKVKIFGEDIKDISIFNDLSSRQNISHSFALDLLYLGLFVLFLFALIWSIISFVY